MSSVFNIQGQLKIQGVILTQASGLWEFPQPTSGTTLSNFYIKTIGNVTCSVDWGDGNIEVINSATPTNHTY